MAAKKSEFESGREIRRKGSISIYRSRMRGLKNKVKNIFLSRDGMGVVEVILIIVVLIGLVIIFQTNIKGVVASIFATIEKNANSIQ